MSVKLVSITSPEISDGTEKITMTPEEFVVYIARVSNPSNQMNTETAPKLINYLVKHKHWSPFEFVDMTVEIVTRRSIAAQILRHKSFSFQEFSQRYSSVTNVQEIEIRKQAEKNRQSSAESFNPTLSESKITNYKQSGQIKASEAIGDFLEASMRLYSELIDAGVAREVARDILPLATETTMYMKGSLRSWIHYLELRTGDDTQKEHRDIANQIKHIFIENFPNIGEALNFKN
jgi:thymidylate synthase (FAD)